MLDLNFNEIHRLENELTHFNGWLPFRLWLFIDIEKRDKYLKFIGAFDKIHKENEHYVDLLRDSNDDDALMDKLLKKFVKDNPKFKNIIK